MRTHKKYRSMNAACHIGKIKRLESQFCKNQQEFCWTTI